MKADSQDLARESANADQALADPFAVDLFASENAAFETPPAIFPRSLEETEEASVINRGWASRLPRVSPDRIEASSAIAGLASETYTQIQGSLINVLARYLATAPDDVSVSLVEIRELDLSSPPAEPNESGSTFATFTGEPGGASFSFELEARFAAMLVDRMLGGDGDAPDSLRPLTKTESAVVEYLCLSFASELNRQIGQPLLRLRSIGEQPPWLTSRIQKATTTSGSAREIWNRCLMATLRIGAGNITGIARAYMNASALSALNEAHRQLRAAGQTSTTGSDAVELERFARFVPDLNLTVLIGTTGVTPEELFELEAGDVMLVEKPSLRWRRQSFKGSLLVRLGDANEALINGEVSPADGDRDPAIEQDEAHQAGSIRIRVGAVAISPPPIFAERLMMEEEAGNAEVLVDSASVIEAVMLTVHVELGARRLRLDELSRLRANQILDLGCKATDPVDLVVDARRIARGELVDIEGRLGVRITHVSG